MNLLVPHPAPRNKWFAAVLLPAIASILSLSACTSTKKVEANASTPTEPPTVAVAKASVENLSHDLVLTAEFRPFQEIEVMAKVAGYVKQIYVDVGDRVKAGQLLATLEVPEMADEIARASAGVERSNAEVTRARDEITRAESAHQIAHVTYERLADVAKKRPGLIAQQEVDDAQSKDLMAEAQVASTKSSLAVALQAVGMSKADLGKSKTLSDYTRVAAPFSGVITKRFANTGSMIQAGTASQTQAMPVVRLSQNRLLRLTLPVPESAVPRVHIGQQVEVRVPTLNHSFPGKVARFSDRVQTATRTMETEVDVPNPSFVLVPGMYAEVDLTMDKRAGTLAIPVSAVDHDSEADGGARTARVLVVTAANRIDPRKITLGMETANYVEVRSGLEAGDLVVIGNRASLQPGQHVKPRPVTMAAITNNQ